MKANDRDQICLQRCCIPFFRFLFGLLEDQAPGYMVLKDETKIPCVITFIQIFANLMGQSADLHDEENWEDSDGSIYMDIKDVGQQIGTSQAHLQLEAPYPSSKPSRSIIQSRGPSIPVFSLHKTMNLDQAISTFCAYLHSLRPPHSEVRLAFTVQYDDEYENSLVGVFERNETVDFYVENAFLVSAKISQYFMEVPNFNGVPLTASFLDMNLPARLSGNEDERENEDEDETETDNEDEDEDEG